MTHVTFDVRKGFSQVLVLVVIEATCGKCGDTWEVEKVEDRGERVGQIVWYKNKKSVFNFEI